ncbi:hypothetical protein J2Y69_001606 [Microbacterium resistens]|uniref:Secreted protein n=1 Tax=Microbacterium resistens TaxID=156977 RepID=A0ABU1SDP5_9MICO|nr:hypothetical protein [Microbacterium resistens]MDR6867007.1 hypothetical protein [Microbacterium resistens]
MNNEQTTAPKGIDRRSLVKGAAWSLPVIAAASALPMASASVNCPTPTQPWDIGITGGCMIDFWGAGRALPGFTVTAAGPKDANGCCLYTTPTSPLTITESAKGNWYIEIPDLGGLLYAAWTVAPAGGVILSAPFIAWAFAYATALVGALVIPATLAGYGPHINGPLWLAPASIGDFLNFSVTPQVVGSGFGRKLRVNVTFTLNRTLTLTNMPSCSETGWGYLGGITPPSPTDNDAWQALISIPLFGAAISSAAGTITPDLTLTATGNWADANNGNNVGTIGNQVLAANACD